MNPLWNYEEVVKALGGPAELGRLLGYANGTVVWNWRDRNGAFPAKHYFVMREALRERGHYAPMSLWGFTSGVRPRRMWGLQESESEPA